jgi:hypothetical protein
MVKNNNLDQFQFPVGDQPDKKRLIRRAELMQKLDEALTKAHRRKGGVVMASDYAEDLGLQQDKITKNYNRLYNLAQQRKEVLCGKCAIRGCILRNEPVEEWDEKYYGAPERHRQVKKTFKDAENSVERPC